MTQNYVSVVFDRKKKANTNKSGKGKIELYIQNVENILPLENAHQPNGKQDCLLLRLSKNKPPMN